MQPTHTPQPIEVLPAHRFDEKALVNYFYEALPGFEGPATIRQFQGGQSNPTFMVSTPGRRYVLRKKPPGKLLPSAHQVEREFMVLKALYRARFPVPEPIVLCENADIIGTAFYVMAYVDNRVFSAPAMPGVTPDERRGVYNSLADTLAQLHKVDWRGCGLENFGRPEGYLTRQVERWTKQYIATKTDEMPGMDELMAWLPKHIPDSHEAAVAHGDYRLGNLLIDPTEPKVVAVVDWELATIGHPLSDLAYACIAYRMPPGDPVFEGLAGVDLAALGIPTEKELVARYCQAMGRDAIADWPFYLAFSHFRLAAITQGVYHRSVQGNASDLKAKYYGAVAKQNAAIGWHIAQNGT